MIDRIGMSFRILGPDDWNDLSAVDVLIGIRSFSRATYDDKPATKLYNAWHATIPFVGGWDSAFSFTGTPGRDYIRVENIDELEAELKKIRGNPDYYRRLVENGNVASKQYTREAICDKWIFFIETIAVPDFLQWNASSYSTRKVRFFRSFLSHITHRVLRNLIPKNLTKTVHDYIRHKVGAANLWR